ncbi:MAG: hypothetical protein K2Q20_06710 [Phycisphaerales bacterium]|nr:hypothetical protein [Phycisphaerales bacterium]
MTATDRIPDPLDTLSRARLWHSGGFWTLIAITSWFLFMVPCCGVCGSIDLGPGPGRTPVVVPTFAIRVDPATPPLATVKFSPENLASEPGVYWVHYTTHGERTGWLSPTLELGPTVTTNYNGVATPGVPPQLAPVVAAAVASQAPSYVTDFNAAVAAGGTATRVLWAGYAQNALLLLFGCMALFATARCAALFMDEVIGHRRHQRGICPSCKYNLHGLPSRTYACPECGEPIGITTPRRA